MKPSGISIGAVVREAEADTALVECFDRESSECRIAPACAARGVLARAQEAFFKVLDDTTLADLLRSQQRLSVILFEPQTRRRSSRAG